MENTTHYGRPRAAAGQWNFRARARVVQLRVSLREAEEHPQGGSSRVARMAGRV